MRTSVQPPLLRIHYDTLPFCVDLLCLVFLVQLVHSPGILDIRDWMPEQCLDARHQMCERGRLHEGLREGNDGQCGQHGLEDHVNDGIM